jgi:DNA helicase-4
MFIFIVLGVVFFLILSILLIPVIKQKIRERKIKKIEEENERNRLIKIAIEKETLRKKNELEQLKSLSIMIKEVVIKFEELLEFRNGYLNNTKIQNWLDNSKHVIVEIDKIGVNTKQLNGLIGNDYITLNYYLRSFKDIITKRNNEFIQSELIFCKDMFDDVNGTSLDQQQRIAIIKDEDNNLIVAGAGSGKTTTVAGKVKYLIHRFNIKPHEILLITFTRKASEEMRERISSKMGINIDVNTFHSFGRQIIGNVTNCMPRVIKDSEIKKNQKVIFNNLMNNDNFKQHVLTFLTEFNIENKYIEDFETHGDYINYLKDNKVFCYKRKPVAIHGKITFLNEKCNSYEEVKIANYLFLNNVNYEYEKEYEYPTANNKYSQYKPDFYLTDYGIYIEHFGLTDRYNNVPKFFIGESNLSPKEKYNAGIKWKRDIHNLHNTKLVETYSYENKEGVLLENLKIRLQAHNVVFTPKTNDEIWSILNEVVKDDLSTLDTLILTFMALFKSNNYEIDILRNKISEFKDINDQKRHLLFLDIFEPILNKYNEYLLSSNLIDFSDMINHATNYINENKFNISYKYIIIDEFQDTSIGRFKLIRSMLDNNSSCKLFAVGDDWQSIYRFAGSDISLFTDFEQYFGKTEVSFIETTYRFGIEMIKTSSEFILKNPFQKRKTLKSNSIGFNNPIEIIYANSIQSDDVNPMIDALNKINVENENKSNFSILALARYNHILDSYENHPDFIVSYNKNDNSSTLVYKHLNNLKVKFLTVHKAKGLEADFVIILNCVSGSYGFPSERADDTILNLLLSKSDRFKNGEERRLFYVALTRAKQKTYITTNRTYTSKFIKEIDPNYVIDKSSKCPFCHDGSIILKEGIAYNGRQYKKYTCSNWNFGCEYLKWG